MSEAWRSLVAALDDPTRRAVYASLVVGSEVDALPLADVPAKEKERALSTLANAGLLTATDNGYVVNDEAFKKLLDEDPQPTRQGVERFIRAGRIEAYPSRPGDRAELLAWAADRVLAPGEVLSEHEISERLEAISDDFASLRRYIVDAGLVTREADGRSYRRVISKVQSSTASRPNKL